MASARVISIQNDIQPYAWGMPGGVSRALGRPDVNTIEAELWLGAHPNLPSRPVDVDSFADLADWQMQTGAHLPFLLKILTAAQPLSLQAHPNPEQARAGYDREESAGIARTAFERSYKDPFAKPELIVALEDGFQALCGFRPIAKTAAVLDEIASQAQNPEPISRFRELLQTEGLKNAVAFTLSRTPEVKALVRAITETAEKNPEQFEVVQLTHAVFPNDDGIAFALLLNHVTLKAGESLWLPAGNVHAYLYGSGVELMGPSDNVLRGGLTPKHVDVDELMNTLVFEESVDPTLPPEQPSPAVKLYRPASVPTGSGVEFELIALTGDAELTLENPAIGVVTDGGFSILVEGAEEEYAAPQGATFLITEATRARISGTGKLWIATSR